MSNPILYSYSRLDKLDQCGWKYKLTYEDKHYIYCKNIATEFGSLVHATEEAIAKAIRDNLKIDYEVLIAHFKEAVTELKQQYPEDFYTKDKSNRTYEDKVNHYLTKSIYRLEQFMQKNPQLEIIGIEQGFQFDYKNYSCYNVQFKGYIDRLFRDKVTGKVIIQDIKTYAVPIDQTNLTTPLQFVIYTLAVEQMYGVSPKDVSCQYILPLCPNVDTGESDFTQSAGTRGFISRGIKKLDKLFERINRRDFQPNPTSLCHWCEFCPTNPHQSEEGKHLCPYYSLWTQQNPTYAVAFEWLGEDYHPAIMKAYYKQIGGEKNGL